MVDTSTRSIFDACHHIFCPSKRFQNHCDLFWEKANCSYYQPVIFPTISCVKQVTMIVMEGIKEVAMISHMVMGDNHDHIIMLKCNYCLIFILFVV